jgi:hypothetical protein
MAIGPKIRNYILEELENNIINKLIEPITQK